MFGNRECGIHHWLSTGVYNEVSSKNMLSVFLPTTTEDAVSIMKYIIISSGIARRAIISRECGIYIYI